MEQMVLLHDDSIRDNTKRIEQLEKFTGIIEVKLDTTNQLLKYIIATLLGGVAIPIVLDTIIK